MPAVSISTNAATSSSVGLERSTCPKSVGHMGKRKKRRHADIGAGLSANSD